MIGFVEMMVVVEVVIWCCNGDTGDGCGDGTSTLWLFHSWW